MNLSSINDVKIIPLKKIEDERGAVMHMLRADQPHFSQFGEIYFSLVKPGVTKGWKLHKRITQNMAVPEGDIKLTIYDSRIESSTYGKFQIIEFGQQNFCLVQLPPNVWYAFKAISTSHAIITNCTTDPHDPLESEVLPLETELIPVN
jgi:dTDP-4-dehydrorhamnose 3,5-epimerase